MADAPKVVLPPGWRPEWAPPKRALEEARRLAAPAPPDGIKSHADTLVALSREATDDSSPAGARVSALRALAELLPPVRDETNGDIDCSRLSDEELDTFLHLLAKCKPEETTNGPT